MTDDTKAPTQPNCALQTARIVIAYLQNHPLAPDALPGLIRRVDTALSQALSSGGDTPTAEPRPTPAVPIKRSVFPDYVVCLEDGKKLKMLKRHLRTAYGMSIEDYRKKWGLPETYPVVAPNYSRKRSDLAREMGLGQHPGTANEAPREPPSVPVQKIPEARRGRRRGPG